MRQREKKAWVVVFVVIGVLGNFGMVPVQGADPTEMPTTPPPPATTQPPVSPGTQMPEGQGKGEHRKQAEHRLKQACGEDIKKLCQNVQPGGGRIVQCLEQHQADVSQNCNQLLTKKESRQGKGH